MPENRKLLHDSEMSFPGSRWVGEFKLYLSDCILKDKILNLLISFLWAGRAPEQCRVCVCPVHGARLPGA